MLLVYFISILQKSGLSNKWKKKKPKRWISQKPTTQKVIWKPKREKWEINADSNKNISTIKRQSWRPRKQSSNKILNYYAFKKQIETWSCAFKKIRTEGESQLTKITLEGPDWTASQLAETANQQQVSK